MNHGMSERSFSIISRDSKSLFTGEIKYILLLFTIVGQQFMKTGEYQTV